MERKFSLQIIKKIAQVPLTNQNGTCIILNRERYKYQYKVEGA